MAGYGRKFLQRVRWTREYLTRSGPSPHWAVTSRKSPGLVGALVAALVCSLALAGNRPEAVSAIEIIPAAAPVTDASIRAHALDKAHQATSMIKDPGNSLQ